MTPRYPLSRPTDPVTSHVAASRVPEFAATQEGIIFGAICDAGERGATSKEIAAVTTLTDVQCSRRLAGMHRRGVVTRTWPDGRLFGVRDGCAVWKKA